MRKKAVIDGLQGFPGSIKANLEKVGLAQSTYYGWLRQYKAKGIEGLDTGNQVSDSVWKRYGELKKKQQEPVKAESTLTGEEKQTMTSKNDEERTKKLLFKRFDEEASGGETEKKGPESVQEKTGCASSCSSGDTPKEPMDKTLRYGIGAFACVVAVLLMASLFNTSQFYFKQKEQGVELWQGRFAPMGERLVAGFPSSQMLEGLEQQESYSKKQAFGALFDHLVQQADDALNEGRTPDLKAVRSYLNQASRFATTTATRGAIRMRLNSINFLVLSGKADLALNKGTLSDFDAAKGYLTESIPFASTDIQKEIITKRLAAIEYAMATSKISKGEKELARMYRDALNRHLKKAKAYSPEKSAEIDLEIQKIQTWLDDFDKRHLGKKK